MHTLGYGLGPLNACIGHGGEYHSVINDNFNFKVSGKSIGISLMKNSTPLLLKKSERYDLHNTHHYKAVTGTE